MQVRFIGSVLNFFLVNSACDSASKITKVQLAPGNNVEIAIDGSYVQNKLLHISAVIGITGDINRYQRLVSFPVYTSTVYINSIGHSPYGKTAQIYCINNTNGIYINILNGYTAGDNMIIDMLIPVE